MHPPTAGPSPQACPQCGALGTTRFCGDCGHPMPTIPAPSEDIRALVREGAAEAFGLDHRLLATGRDLLLHPARVIAAHLAGRAGSYVHPLKLFLFLAGLYMLCLAWLQPFSFMAEATGRSSYRVSLAQVVYGGASAAEIRRMFADHGLTEEAADARFQERANAAIPLATILALVPMAMVLRLLQRERPLRDHFTFLLVISNAIWLVSLLVLPIYLVSRAAGLIALYVGAYLYLAVGFFAIYAGRGRARTAGRFAAFAVTEFVVRSLVSVLLSVAILASIFYP